MAKIVNNLDQVRTINQSINGHATTSSNTHSQLQSSDVTSNANATKTGVVSKKMGSVVSRLNAALFGTGYTPGNKSSKDRQPDTTNRVSNRITLQPDYNSSRRLDPESQTNGGYLHKTEYNSSQSDLEYCSARGSVSDSRSDTPITCNTPSLIVCNELSETPSLGRGSTPTDRSKSSDKENQGLPQNQVNTDNEVINISEDEYSADEEQEEVSENDNETEDELQRLESDKEENDEDTEQGAYQSDDESSEIAEDESEVESEEEHVCHSDCDHSDEEYEQEDCSEDNQSEYDSNQEQEIMNSENDREVVEFTASSDEGEEEVEEYESQSEEEYECNSECPSDCDGNHHECSSECDCQFEHSDSDREEEEENHQLENDNMALHNGHHIPNEDDTVSPLRESAPPFPTSQHSGFHKRQGSLPSPNELLEQQLKLKNNKTRSERNNNKLHPSNSVDIMGELRTAIDARVRRSASYKEVPMYRKLSATSLNVDEQDYTSKLDAKEREARRKDRRARLRTLEIKREKILTEVRDGTKERVTDAMYSEEIVG